MIQRSIRQILVIVILLCSVNFFSLYFLGGYQTEKLINISGIFIIIFFIILHIFYDNTQRFPSKFKLPIIIIFIAVLLSMYVAFTIHRQSFIITAFAQRGIYFFLLYFLLHYFKLLPKQLEMIVVIFGVLFSICYIAQYFAFPTKLFEVRMWIERSTVRIFLPGLGFLTLAYFYSLNRFLIENRLIFIIVCLFFLVVFFLYGTRQNLLAILLITFLSPIISRTVKSRVFLIFLIIISLISGYFIFQNIINDLISLSQYQISQFEEDIRLKAAQYFIKDFSPDRLAAILGNGESSEASDFGLFVRSIEDNYHFFQADIGLIGEYSKYGILFILGVLIIIIRILTRRLSSSMVYLKFYIFAIILTMFTGGGMFSNSDNVTVTCLIMYFVDVNNFEIKSEQIAEPGIFQGISNPV